MARILGVSCYFHDAAAALVVDGALIRAAEEERFSRRKHDASFPELAIRFCLEEGPVDYVAFYEDPRVKLRRVLATTAAMGKPAEDAFVGSMRAFLGERRGIRGRLARIAGVPEKRVLFVGHHLSHAASAFFPSPFESAALMTIDGVGEWSTATIGRAETVDGRHTLEITNEIDFPHSLGLFYSALTDFLGFEVNEGEYKVMGMAPYGEPRFVDRLEQVLSLYDDGSFWLDMSYFTFHHSSRRAYSDKLVELLGVAPRKRDARFWTSEDADATPEDLALRPAVRGHCRQRARGHRPGGGQSRPRSAAAFRLDGSLLRWRRGVERDGEHSDPAGHSDRALVHSPRSRRFGRGARRRPLRRARRPRKPGAARARARVLGRRVRRRADRGLVA